MESRGKVQVLPRDMQLRFYNYSQLQVVWQEEKEMDLILRTSMHTVGLTI